MSRTSEDFVPVSYILLNLPKESQVIYASMDKGLLAISLAVK